MKLYQIISFFLCFGFITSSISFAQSPTTQNKNLGENSGNYKEVIESLQIGNELSNKINQVSFYFCNSGLEYKNLTTFLEMDIVPGESRNICMIFVNKSEETLDIIAGFTKGNISNPSDKVFDIICETEITGKNTFGNIIQNNYENEFSLGSKEIKIQNFSIKIPPNLSGTIYSCGMFKIKGNIQKAAGSSMFDIQAVKKMPIKINITGDAYNYGPVKIINNKDDTLKGFIIIVGLILFISVIKKISKKDKKQYTKNKSKHIKR